MRNDRGILVRGGLTLLASLLPLRCSAQDKIRSGRSTWKKQARGLAHAINFQPTRGGRAAIIGDFVLISTEVNPVIKGCELTESR